MKKRLALVLCFVLAFSMCTLTGCGKNADMPYNYNLSDYVELGDYMGVKISPMPEITVTSEDIQAEIANRVAEAATTKDVTEGVVENGDTLNIDYAGTINGEAFDGGTAQGKPLTIGSHMFIDGFEDGLIGHSIGETVVLDLTFPDPYTTNPDLSGKPCQFTVKINSKQVKVTYEYDIDFVKMMGFESLDAYEQSVYDELYKKAEDQAKYNREEQAWTAIAESSKVIKYPEAEMAEVIEEYKSYCTSYMSQYGYTLDDYLTMNNITQEDFDADCQKYGESVVKNEMVLYAIAQAEGITISKDEYEKVVNDAVASQGYDDRAAFEKAIGGKFEDYMSPRNIYTSAMLEKVMALVIENAVEE